MTNDLYVIIDGRKLLIYPASTDPETEEDNYEIKQTKNNNWFL